MPITRRDNLLAVLRGEEPAWTPVSINCCQWFAHHRATGSLPPELAEGDYLDALLLLDFDIFSRNHDGGYRTHCELPSEERVEDTPQGRRVTATRHTPHGDLVHVRQEQRAISTWHDERYPVDDWAGQRRAIWAELEHSTAWWDRDAFQQIRTRIGDAGVFLVPCGCTPLKQLHRLCGLEGACYAICDQAADVEAYAWAWWRRVLWPVLERLAGDPAVDAVILMDNVDAPFYPPTVAEWLWTPFVRAAVDLCAAHDTSLWVHACGQLAALRPAFAASGVAGLEGIAHPPLGDLDVALAHDIHPGFIYNGGFGAHEQTADSDAVLTRTITDLLTRARGQRLIVASACNTAVETPLHRIRLARDLVRAHDAAG